MGLFSKISELGNNKVVRSMGIYTFSNFFARGISFLLIPVFTNPAYLTPEDNGLLSLFSQSLIFLTPFISLGVLQSISTDFFKMEKNAFRDFVTTGFAMSITVTVLSVAVLYGLSDTLQQQYHFPPSFIWIIPLVTFGIFCIELLLGLVRNNNDPVRYFLITSSKIVIELGVSLVLICFYKWGWYGRVTGIGVASVFIVIVAFRYFISKGYLIGSIHKQYIRQELIYALPIILMTFGIFCTNSSDNFILAHKYHGDTHVVGIYAIACTFASVIFLLSTAVMQYMIPLVYSILAQSAPDFKKIKRVFGYYVLIMTGGLVMLLFFIPIAYKLFINEAYHPALGYYYFLVAGYYFWSIAYFFHSFLLFNKQKRKLTILSVFNIVVSLTLYYSFTQIWDVKGTAIAVCLSFFLIFCFTLLLNRKVVQRLLGAGRIMPTGSVPVS